MNERTERYVDLTIKNWIINHAGVIINDKKISHSKLRHEYLIFVIADVYSCSLLINEFLAEDYGRTVACINGIQFWNET